MKKLLGFPLMVAMVLNFSATAFAAEESSVDSYNKVLAEINEEYGQEIGIESVDTSQVTNIIDSGRTLTVSAYGTVQGGGVTFTNVYVYTEFYYGS